MADPVTPHLISGTVFDIYGDSLASATVTVKHPTIGPTAGISTTSASDGKYILNLSGLESPWTVGDTITLTASKTAEGTKTVSTTIKDGGSQTENITLAETSDIAILGTDTTERHNLYFALPTHYDKAKVTRERGLPVHNVLERQYTQAFAKLSGGQQVEYQGWANPGSRKGESVWRIRKLVYDGTFTTDIVWAGGNQNFEHSWADRESLEYK